LMGLDELVRALCETVPKPKRSADCPFLFEFDHCFAIKGQGTVLTGTVLRGALEVNQTIELPVLKEQRRVKSMQMFHKPVSRAIQGDRVGLCVPQLDAKLLERGIAAAPASVPMLTAAIVTAHRVRFFKGDIRTKATFHVTVGHLTVMATAHFFGTPASSVEPPVNLKTTYTLCQEELNHQFKRNAEYENHEELIAADKTQQYAILQFEQPITAPLLSLVIASRLDTDIKSNTCRLAFFGRLLSPVDSSSREALHQQLKIFKMKSKQGLIERVDNDKYTVIGKELFKKETDMSLFVGLKVTKESGEVGVIESSFGKSGKFKVRFDKDQTGARGPLFLSVKRYIFDPTKRILQ